jgi:hypothetical protein
MIRFIVLSLVLVLLFPAIISAVFHSRPAPSDAWAQAGRTDLMQQSDHKRRAANQQKTKPAQQQTAGLMPIETGTDNGDYLVLAILVGSILTLTFIATRRKKIRPRSRHRTR